MMGLYRRGIRLMGQGVMVGPQIDDLHLKPAGITGGEGGLQGLGAGAVAAPGIAHQNQNSAVDSCDGEALPGACKPDRGESCLVTLIGSQFPGGKNSPPRMGIDYTVNGTTEPCHLFSKAL